MNTRFHVFLGLASICLFGAACSAESSSGVAVVELFTSEGCSSCPSADQLLAQLHKTVLHSAQPVYFLAFHVDYWNRLGWTDRFSDPAYTQRQNDYGRRMRLDGVYTPQMIVNGTAQFVGSDKLAAERSIAAALKQPAPVNIALKPRISSPGRLSIEYSCTNAGDHDLVNIAVVEDSLTTAVARGENAGRHLDHDAVVRRFTTRPISADRRDVVAADLGDIAVQNARVVVYVQDSESLAIRGAAMTPLPAR